MLWVATWISLMDQDFLTIGSTKKRWPFRLLLLPVAFLGVVGFLVNFSNLSLLYPPLGSCRTKTNIVFLKTHKCAGSSVQNILMRFGDVHNLTFVLPAQGNYLGHPSPFSKALLPKPKLKTYNILAHHTRLDYKEIKQLMPLDTVFITIVRDPVQVFESSFVYYGLDKFFGTTLRKFARFGPRLSPKFVNRRLGGKFGVNQMLFDLGADTKILNNETLVREYVNRLDNWFDYVLVAERMNESLVLLKELLCWSLDDVVTFKLNARNPVYKSNLTELEKANLRLLNSADQILYDHFVAKFERQLQEFGIERAARETLEFQERTKAWYDFCVNNVKPLDTSKKRTYYFNPKVMVFEPRTGVNNVTCKSLIMEELPYTDYLRKKQMSAPKETPKYLARHPHVS